MHPGNGDYAHGLRFAELLNLGRTTVRRAYIFMPMAVVGLALPYAFIYPAMRDQNLILLSLLAILLFGFYLVVHRPQSVGEVLEDARLWKMPGELRRMRRLHLDCRDG